MCMLAWCHGDVIKFVAKYRYRHWVMWYVAVWIGCLDIWEMKLTLGMLYYFSGWFALSSVWTHPTGDRDRLWNFNPKNWMQWQTSFHDFLAPSLCYEETSYVLFQQKKKKKKKIPTFVYKNHKCEISMWNVLLTIPQSIVSQQLSIRCTVYVP